MEIRDQLLQSLDRKRSIQESALRQSQSALNSHRRAQLQTHSCNVSTFAHLKQALLLERSHSTLSAREQVQNLMIIKKKLTLQEREVKASALELERLKQQAELLATQHAQIKEQRRIIQEFSEIQTAGITQRNQDLLREEQGVLAMLKDDAELYSPVYLEPVLSANPERAVYIGYEQQSSLLGDTLHAQSHSSSDQRAGHQAHYQTEPLEYVDPNGSRRDNQHHASEHEADPQLAFKLSDYDGDQIAVALTLRAERGIEVNIQHKQMPALVQSQHQARRIERTLRQAGLEVAQVTIG
jgi:hypothetical protein